VRAPAPRPKAPRVDWTALAREAEDARARAYAPYSGYAVGAALLARNVHGDVGLFLGANVENAAYPLGLCAERNAISAAVIAGARELVAIAVATKGPQPGTPCGACRQVLAEFSRDVPVALVVGGRVTERIRLDRLLPRAFGGALLPGQLKR
jgi:cytidine deaminase